MIVYKKVKDSNGQEIEIYGPFKPSDEGKKRSKI